MSGELAKLSQIKILVSQYIEDDVMVVSPKTCVKLQSWYSPKIKTDKNKLHPCPYNKACKCDMADPCLGCEEFKPKETKESEGA